MPSPDPLVAFLYLLMRDAAPTGAVAGAIDQAAELVRSGRTPEFTSHELEKLAERYAEKLRALPTRMVDGGKLPMVPRPPYVSPSPTSPDPSATVQPIPELAPGQKRTGKQSVILSLETNPGCWLKLAQIHASIGERRSYGAVRVSVQELVRAGRLLAEGETSSRVYRLADEHDREHTSGQTSEGSSEHADSAENSPPRSPSGQDESANGGESSDEGRDQDRAKDGPVDATPAGASPPKPPKMPQLPPSRLRRPEPEPEDAEPWVPHRAKPKAEAAPPSRLSVGKVLGEIEPWVRRQQTFRRRQLQEAFPHFDASEIRSALTAMGIRGTIQIGTVQAGEPMYSVVSNADKGGEARPDPSSTGTVEGAVLSFVEARDGATVLAVANGVGVPQHEVGAVLSKLRSEGDVREMPGDPDPIFVRAA